MRLLLNFCGALTALTEQNHDQLRIQKGAQVAAQMMYTTKDGFCAELIAIMSFTLCGTVRFKHTARRLLASAQYYITLQCPGAAPGPDMDRHAMGNQHGRTTAYEMPTALPPEPSSASVLAA